MKKIAFRMDDVGASTKQFEVYSKSYFGNFLFLKYIYPFKAWAPYRELNEKDWEEITVILGKYGAHLTVAITAAWVDEKNDLIPFPEEFPKQAKVLKEASKNGLVEIANHGLTHCVVGRHLPRLFLSNRKYHREFYKFLPEDLIKDHLDKSQKILEDYFETKVITFVPPGNVCTDFAKEYAMQLGLSILSGREKNTFAFHDRDIVLNGPEWLREKIIGFRNKEFIIVKVKDL